MQATGSHQPQRQPPKRTASHARAAAHRSRERNATGPISGSGDPAPDNSRPACPVLVGEAAPGRVAGDKGDWQGHCRAGGYALARPLEPRRSVCDVVSAQLRRRARGEARGEARSRPNQGSGRHAQASLPRLGPPKSALTGGGKPPEAIVVAGGRSRSGSARRRGRSLVAVRWPESSQRPSDRPLSWGFAARREGFEPPTARSVVCWRPENQRHPGKATQVRKGPPLR